MNLLSKKSLENACVNLHLLFQSEMRDQKLVLALSYTIYVSALLAGYAMFVNVDFLLRSTFVAGLIGICTAGFLVLHDQSLLATDNRRQVYTKIAVSLLLAISFTLTNSADKEYESLSVELIQNVNRENSYVLDAKTSEINKIDQEEMVIMERIEKAAEISIQNIQPLADARRSLVAFKANKDQRIQLIHEKYKDRFNEASITDLNILALQVKKFANGGEGTFIAIILAFLFFIIESLPAILRIMLDSGDYMIRYLASLHVVRNLRDQRIVQQYTFATPDSCIISNLLYLEIINKKSELIRNGFQDTEEMVILDQRQKILNAGFNPYTSKPLDYIDPSFFAKKNEENDEDKNEENSESDNSYSKNNDYHEEPVFDL